jgi:hypothetical protein
MQNNFLQIFKYEVTVIQFVWQILSLNVMQLVYSYFLLRLVHRQPVTSLLTGLWRDQGWSVSKAKQLFSPKPADQFWGPPSFIL